ncbi:MAG TPA: nuclear transport factor 2 family protein [Verrucomicrobiae bacterium]|nr:nuclear transport factor 2 family protein [Verrucomicrobiae bacterium]
MLRRLITVALFLLLTLSICAQTKKMSMKAAGPAPDRAFVQKIWDGWSTLDPANVAPYYASGPNTFFDIAPLKYSSWEDYEGGVRKVVADYKSAKFTVNDDLAVHPHTDLVWATATIKEEMTSKAGKVEMGTFRWTAVWENQGGKWLIVHEHVSQPIQ